MNCPVDQPEDTTQTNKEPAQFYAFTINEKRAVIKTHEKDFVINDLFPNLLPEGQLVLAILAYTGFFNGSFYDDTHEETKSDIFIYFDNLKNITNLKNLKTGEELATFIFQPESKLKLERFMIIDSEHLSEVFKIIKQILQVESIPIEEADVFKSIDELILKKNDNSWQNVFDFWKEYIDIKKQSMNFAEFKVRKVFKSTRNNPLLAEYMRKEVQYIHTFKTFLASKIFRSRT